MQRKQVNKGNSTGYQAENINIYNVIRNTSILADVVNAISKINLDDEGIFGAVKEKPIIEDKINHNSIEKYRYLIDDYQIYGKELGKIYNTLEKEKPGRKAKLLRVISDFYKKEKGVISTDGNFEDIKNNSDLIIENIINQIETEIVKSSNLNADNEDVKNATSIVVADAFIACKILENPNDK